MAFLHPTAQKVQDFIDQHNIWCSVIQKETTARTAQEAADSIGCEVAQIVKSLIFMTKSKKPVLCLVSGTNRLDEKKVNALLGENIERADADFVREVTGFAIGGIPPFGHVNKIESIFVDKDLLAYTAIWAAAGHPNAVFEISPQKLVEVTEGQVADIKL